MRILARVTSIAESPFPFHRRVTLEPLELTREGARDVFVEHHGHLGCNHITTTLDAKAADSLTIGAFVALEVKQLTDDEQQLVNAEAAHRRAQREHGSGLAYGLPGR